MPAKKIRFPKETGFFILQFFLDGLPQLS